MNYLDLYLQRNNCKRYDVYKRTGISQQLLASHTNKNPDKFSSKVLISVAEALEKTPGTVLDELLELQKENPAFEAFNPDELLIALNYKYDTIIIKGAYSREVYKIMQGQLSETETLGLELGSAGMVTVLAYAINEVKNLFSKSDKIEQGIEKKLPEYKLVAASKEEVVLKLKMLDY